MQNSLQGNMPQEQVLHILHTLAKGSLNTFETLLPFLSKAFPNLVVVEEGLPEMPLLWGDEDPTPLIRALAAASSQGLGLIQSRWCLTQLTSSSSSNVSSLLTKSAALCMTICCRLCNLHMEMSVFRPNFTDFDRRSAQVELAVTAQHTGVVQRCAVCFPRGCSLYRV
jgi:hypothetical protein